MARLLLVRHGITEFNSTRRFAGYSDVEMSATGYQQIEKLRDRLAKEKIDVIYASDLKRARVTAELLSAGRQVEIIACSELREANYGMLEGLTFAEISRLYPEIAESVTNSSFHLKFPGGETFEEFIERTSQFLERLKGRPPAETMLIVAHSGPLRLLVCRLLGIDLNCWWQIRCDNASLSIVETYPSRTMISLLNDTSHLGEAGN